MYNFHTNVKGLSFVTISDRYIYCKRRGRQEEQYMELVPLTPMPWGKCEPLLYACRLSEQIFKHNLHPSPAAWNFSWEGQYPGEGHNITVMSPPLPLSAWSLSWLGMKPPPSPCTTLAGVLKLQWVQGECWHAACCFIPRQLCLYLQEELAGDEASLFSQQPSPQLRGRGNKQCAIPCWSLEAAAGLEGHGRFGEGQCPSLPSPWLWAWHDSFL